jgi:hypothetical protein
MSAKYHVYGINDITSTKITEKHTLIGALNIADDLLPFWDDILIREYPETEPETFDGEPYITIARLSAKGIL